MRCATTVGGAALALAAAALQAGAQAAASDTGARVTVGGFVDGYYAYDFGRPASLDRTFAGGAPFTTQPARHNEFNINLAHLEAIVRGPRLRGRVALQAGTSVQANYAAEPTRGAISGPAVSRFIQEAYVGYRVAHSLWIDGGVFFSNVGMESWVSSQNPTYTRSLVADYSPYYSAGVRAIWHASGRLTARLDVVNGWQNVSETNSDKAAGARIDYTLSPKASVSFYTFLGNEVGSRLRFFNGVGATGALTDRVRVLAQVDVGMQEREGGGHSTWYGYTLIGRYQALPLAALSGRLERYDDRDQIIAVTGRGTPALRANGASIGVDVAPHPGLLWRTEVRAFSASNAIFPDRPAPDGCSKRSGFVVSSLALAF